MIKLIAAIDNKLGLANDHGIPWQGKLPTDVKLFRDKTMHSNVLMGFRTYEEFEKPLSDRHNFVATHDDSPLREGFEAITDTSSFLRDAKEDVWVIGGAGLFAQTIQLADELYLTHLDADFNCTKFFPEFSKDFELVEKNSVNNENGISFYFARYVPVRNKFNK